MRRPGVVVVVVLLVGTGCGAGGGVMARGRQGSWHRADEPAFTAGPAFAVAGVSAPGDGYAAWTAAGRVRTIGTAPGRAAVWSSADGSRWSRVDLDHGPAWASTASAAARRQGLAVVVGTLTTALGERDAAIWTSRDGAAWPSVPLDAVPGDQSVTTVAAGPLGFVAAGVDRQGDRAEPAVWSSADGQTWRRVGAGPGSPFVASTRIAGVAVGAAGAVAVGTIDTGGDVDGMAWFSADGTAWRSVPLGPTGFTGRAAQAVNAVTATVGGFVAVGEDANGERRVAVAWTSADGITWQRQPPTADMAGVPESTRGLAGEAVAGAGPIVAVGGSSSLRIWTSPDGRRWTREDGPALGNEAVVATDGAAVLVVAGAALWLRRPGSAWADVGTDAALFPRHPPRASITETARSATGFVAYGTEGTERAIFLSPDGRRWERRKGAEAPFANGRVDAITPFGTELVAVGTDRATRAGHSVAAVWRSADGGATWERVAESNPAFFVRGATQMFGVTAGGPGLVAVGLSFEDTIDAQAWSSVDGRTWRRAAEPAAWSGPGDQYLGAVCALPGGGVVALGTVVDRGEQDVWAWVSQDGVTWERAAGDGAAALGGLGLQYGPRCASTPTGVLATGRGPGPGGFDGRLWATVDGRAWTPLTPATFSAAGLDGLVGVATDGDRVVVTGVDGDDLTVFTSADAGRSWIRRRAAAFGGPGSQFAANVTIAGNEVVMIGRDDASTTVWIGPAP